MMRTMYYQTRFHQWHLHLSTKDVIIGDDDDTDDDKGSDGSFEGDDKLPQPPPEVIEEVFSSMIDSMLRTKEDITGWFSDDEEEDNEEPSDSVQDSKIEKVPCTSKELYNRFKILHC